MGHSSRLPDTNIGLAQPTPRIGWKPNEQFHDSALPGNPAAGAMKPSVTALGFANRSFDRRAFFRSVEATRIPQNRLAQCITDGTILRNTRCRLFPDVSSFRLQVKPMSQILRVKLKRSENLRQKRDLCQSFGFRAAEIPDNSRHCRLKGQHFNPIKCY